MTLLLLSLVAGILTVAAPCILIFLPVILGGSLVSKASANWRRHRSVIIIVSLAVSVTVFTLLLKATTALLSVPQIVWQLLSGSIVALLGLHYLGLNLWRHVASWLRLPQLANNQLARAGKVEGYTGAILTGAALGPVFASCSPTFAYIVAAVIPADLLLGLVYLITYVIGMAGTLLLIALTSYSILDKLGRLNDTSGWLARTVGILFVIVGLLVLTGLDKQLQTFILDLGWYDIVTFFERDIPAR